MYVYMYTYDVETSFRYHVYDVYDEYYCLRAKLFGDLRIVS
jgi:hypothetical protein